MADLSKLIKAKMTFDSYDDAVEQICEKYKDIPPVFPNELEYVKYIKKHPWKYVDIVIYILEKGTPGNGEQKAVEKELRAWLRKLIELVYEE